MTARTLRALIGFTLFAAVIIFNLWHLSEAYGEGPPFYGRTTNMDKWESPAQMLAIVDAVALGPIVVLLLPLLRGRAAQRGVAANSPLHHR
jgi:hypothetical protein